MPASGPLDIAVRPYEPTDAAALAEVMFRSVREGARADYSSAQVAAWLPSPMAEQTVRSRAEDGRWVFVAVDGADRPLGFIDLEADGHIDLLYCVPEAIGRGIGARLYDTLEETARAAGMERLYVEASESARRLFERKGFILRERREVTRRGVILHNYAMDKPLTTDG